MEKILNLKKALEDLGFKVEFHPSWKFVGRDMKTRRCIELNAYFDKEDEEDEEDFRDITLIFHPETFEALDDNLKCPLVE